VRADKEMIQQHQTSLQVGAVFFLSFPKETHERAKQSITRRFLRRKGLF
jgi:hypothetical protein